MAEPFDILAATDYNVRAQISAYLSDLSTRIDNIVAYLKLSPNILGFNLGADPDWTMVNGNVPIVAGGSIGNNPPTITGGDTININSAGYYDITAYFGIDIGSGGNSVLVETYKNGVLEAGLEAGVEFSGGQAAPINQPVARVYDNFIVGDTITFVVTELGTDTKLLLWSISGGIAVQTIYDFLEIVP